MLVIFIDHQHELFHFVSIFLCDASILDITCDVHLIQNVASWSSHVILRLHKTVIRKLLTFVEQADGALFGIICTF